MLRSTNFYFLFFLFVTSLSFSQLTPSDTTRILFIGNSYTYYHSAPELVRQLALEKFPDRTIQVKLVSQGGMTFRRHWESGVAQRAIRSGSWNFVVLQEQSKLGMPLIIDNEVYFGETDLFFEYAKKFDQEIKNSGAETVFFMTWSVKNRPEEQELLTYAYSSIAQELQAKIAPVGLVWDKVRNHKGFDLYARDGSHPSPHGSYLAATTIFSALFNENPVGLSGKISGHQLSSSGNPSLNTNLLVDIPEDDANQIQMESWNLVKQAKENKDFFDLKEPEPHFSIPTLPEGDEINSKNISGKWFGNSTYGSDYLGMILDIKEKNEKLSLGFSFYSPNKKDIMNISDVGIESNQLHFTMVDSLRNLNSRLSFSLESDRLKGLSKSAGSALTVYTHWDLSKEQIYNEIDLVALDQLFEEFETEIEKVGYAEAAMNHYERFSHLINRKYMPEESYLNAEGYNLLREGKIKNALGVFELAMLLYPESVNTYDSFGEALFIAGKKEKALKVVNEGIKLARRTSDASLPVIEATLNKIEQEETIMNDAPPTPAPVPPPPAPPAPPQ
ncbi:SGNH/GDSL hydrolase family protein [Lutimonas zeaxanthinifaciens]|uniref:SGNH/GDSL hydrolase family protein n=1 Tax=Lutimonas zeaxanthinifaciens TaxID=3060215 RepID=UPI00265CC484|nr:SGNH/GDSL hydrolase family protein [Lutimonas sp. YSD2104]WKK65688.1 SGNH/GDSL hydrolase family protein [Lutimonas sp. YSD2104]